jgi:hypothetical protein
MTKDTNRCALLVGILLLAPLPASSSLSTATQTLDSVVASVGNIAITARDVEKEYRLECFLDGRWPPPPADSSSLAAVRLGLTRQLILAQQEGPGPEEKADSEKAAAERFAAVRKEFARPADFDEALKSLGMTEQQVLARLTQQELMLLLIDERLRPEASPSDDDVANYYRSTFIPQFELRNVGAAAPPLADVADQIREILTQKRINELLDQWIQELQPTSPVRIRD